MFIILVTYSWETRNTFSITSTPRKDNVIFPISIVYINARTSCVKDKNEIFTVLELIFISDQIFQRVMTIIISSISNGLVALT